MMVYFVRFIAHTFHLINRFVVCKLQDLRMHLIPFVKKIAIQGIQLVIRFLFKLPSCIIQAAQQEIIMLLISWKIPTL